MITRHKVAIVAIVTSTSIAMGAVTTFIGDTMAAHAQPTANHPAQSRTTRHNGISDMPNLTAPMVSEDRYVNGEWIGHPAPSGLPHASGQCDPCIP